MASPDDSPHDDAADDDRVDQRDLLASRALDGDVAIEELDDDVRTRIEAMRRARAWMTDVEPVAAAVTDAAVAAALAAAGTGTESAALTERTESTPMAPVVPLRRRRFAPALPWLGAVAAAAALVVGVTAITGGGDDGVDVANKADDSATEMAAADGTVGVEERTTTGTDLVAEGDVDVLASLPADGGSVGGESAPAETVSPAEAPAEDTADPQVEMTEAPSTGDVPLLADLGDITRSEASLTTGALCAPDDALLVPAALLGTDAATADLVEVVIDGDGDLVAYSLGDCLEVARLAAD